MEFKIGEDYLNVTKRELEMMKYSVSSHAADNGRVIVETNAGDAECYAAVCRAFLEFIDTNDRSVVFITEKA